MKLRVLWILVAAVLPETLRGDTLEGVVQVVGARVNAKVLLTSPKEPNGPHLCPGEIAKRVRKIPSMTVKAEGKWVNNDNQEKRCFHADSFIVTKGSSGRPVYVGILEKSQVEFVLKRDGGLPKISLVEVPEGLKKMVGKRVVLDLKELDIPTARVPAQRVVFYAEHP